MGPAIMHCNGHPLTFAAPAPPTAVWSLQLEKRAWKNTIFFRGIGGYHAIGDSTLAREGDARSTYMLRHFDELNMDRWGCHPFAC